MNSFKLTIVSPDGCHHDGPAEMVTIRTTEGDVSIMANHMKYVAAIGMGPAIILSEGKRSYGACIGGMLAVLENEVNIVATTFEWADDIDTEHCKESMARAEAMLAKPDLSEADKRIYEAKRRRAKVRLECAEMYAGKNQ